MKTKKSLYLSVALTCLLASAFADNEITDVVGDYFHSGNLRLRAGSALSFYDYRDDIKRGPGIGTGFLNMQYDTPDRGGLQFGVWWLAVKKIWENHDGDYDAIYKQDSDIREIYGKLTLPSTKTSLRGGRFGIIKPGLAGDSHQAAELISADIPNIILRASVINRWINKSRTDMFYKGITGWENVDKVHAEAGDEFWMGSVKMLLGDAGYVEPFASYQEKVMFLYGANAKLTHEIAEDRTIGFNTILARYGNETPREIQPDYQDVFSWLARGSYSLNTLTIGFGWFGIENRRADLAAGVFDRFDPLMEDVTVPYDDKNGANLLFADAEFEIENFKTVVMYGYGKNKVAHITSHELDITVSYKITESLELSAFASLNKYPGADLLPDYIKSGMSLTYSY